MINVDFPDAFMYFNSPMRFKGAFGGRGSAKSWTVAGLLAILGTRSALKILCGREFQTTINDSVKALIDDQIQRYKLDNFYKSMKKEIIGVNGTRFSFCGLKHEPQAIKSMEGIDIFWGEEANTISQASLDFLIPTIRKEGSELWFTYNRKAVDEPVHALKDRPNSDFRQINYDLNPYFPQVLRDEMEYDKRTNYDKYLHIWEGNPQQLSDANVFRGKVRTDMFETPADATIYMGADWGFSTDPAVLLRCFIIGRKLFIDYEAYQVNVDIDDLPDLFDTVPGSRRWAIIADSARPDLIKHMQKQGFKIEGAKKGKDSIVDGIEFLKNYEEIVIHERCKHSAYEFINYQYKIDPQTEEVLPVLIDKDNHCFSGDTLISTDNGHVRIDEIKVGDKVLTRKGYKSVLKVFNNGEQTVKKYKLLNGKSLTATDTHDIITPNGKVKIKDLTKNHNLYYEVSPCRFIKTENQKLQYLTAKGIDGIQKAKEDLTGFISGVQKENSMSQFMSIITVLCKKDIMSITRTVIRLTTLSATLSVLRVVNTLHSTLKSIMLLIRNMSLGISTQSGISQKNGTEVRKGLSGIKSTVKTFLTPSLKNTEYVCAAESISVTDLYQSRFTAQTSVNLPIGDNVVLTTQPRPAVSVEEFSKPINTRKQKHVQGRVQTVYDIMVEDQHEYFANGLLVSNCIDSGRYALEKVRRASRFMCS